MANITLATIADYWKNISDWVKGTDTVSAPAVKLSGRYLEIRDAGITLQSIPAGGVLESSILDMSRVECITIVTWMAAVHSHDLYITYADKNGSPILINDVIYSGSTGNQIKQKLDVAWYKAKLGYKNNDLSTQNFTFLAYGRK